MKAAHDSAGDTTGLHRRAGIPRSVTPPKPRPWLARIIVAVLHAFGALPLRLTHGVASGLARLLVLLPTRERRITAINLGLAFPDMPPRDRRALARRSLIQTARMFAEVGAIWTSPPERITALVREVHGGEFVQAPLDEGRGVIVTAPHLGAWELVGMYLSRRYPMTTLYRAPRIPELGPFFRSARERHGARVVPAGLGAPRALLRALKRGELVGIAPDQDADEGAGVFVPFFGVVCLTMTLVSKMALRTGAAVVLACAERLPRARGFDLHFVPASDEVYDADIARSSAALNRDIERLIRRRPDQYMWSYKRFRTLPPGVPNPY